MSWHKHEDSQSFAKHVVVIMRLFLAKSKLHNFLIAYVCLVAGDLQDVVTHVARCRVVTSIECWLTRYVCGCPWDKLEYFIDILTPGSTGRDLNKIFEVKATKTMQASCKLAGFSLLMTLYFGDIFQQPSDCRGTWSIFLWWHSFNYLHPSMPQKWYTCSLHFAPIKKHQKMVEIV